ncbi:MAG: trypsin-like peptidase domain-containing protein [Candidatus Paceibacterota bacterium]|jgi:S1-C subfamily serine protease
MNTNKKLVFVGVLIVLAMSLGVGYRVAHASFFDNVKEFLKQTFTPSLQSTTSTTAEVPKPAPLYKPALDYEEAVIAAVEKATPSVVSIVISKDVPLVENCQTNPFGDLPPEFQQFFGNGMQFSQPCEKGTTKQEVGGGSGFVVSEDGLIFTNKHVVIDTKAEYTVFTNDGKKYVAKVLARSPVNDIAILKIDATKLTPATLGNSDSVKLGQTAIAIGNSLGEFRNTVSAGVISGLARTVTASGSGFGAETIQGVIQTDAAINPGNSGGPLLNLRGEVIGINTAMASGAQSIGFAIPINSAKRDIKSVKETGSIKVPYLGVRYSIVTEDIAKKQKLVASEGALVRGTSEGPGVIVDSPAAKAGIQAEDIITKINNEKVTTENTIGQIIQKYGIGDMVTLEIKRGDKTLSLNVKLEERPEL